MKAELPPQAWMGRRKPTRERFDRIYNSPYLHVKPLGGLWTCSWDEEGGTPWSEAAKSMHFDVGNHTTAWLLRPGTAWAYVVLDQRGLDELYDRFPLRRPPEEHWSMMPRRIMGRLDWEAIARNYDAVVFPRVGVMEFDDMLMLSLDVPSILWLRWNFYSRATRRVPLPVDNS